MRLVKLVIWLIALLAVIWFGSSVQIGQRTLFGHVAAIFSTEEAKQAGTDISTFTKEKARKAVGEWQQAREVGHRPALDAGLPPAESLTPAEREQLERTIRERMIDDKERHPSGPRRR